MYKTPAAICFFLAAACMTSCCWQDWKRRDKNEVYAFFFYLGGVFIGLGSFLAVLELMYGE